MRPRIKRRTLRLGTGDVQALVIVRREHHTRLVIVDREGEPPLIQALLAPHERKRLARLLGR